MNIQPIKIEGPILQNTHNKNGEMNGAYKINPSTLDEVDFSSKSQELASRSNESDLVLERLKIMPDRRDNLLHQAQKRTNSSFYHSPEFIEELTDKIIDIII